MKSFGLYIKSKKSFFWRYFLLFLLLTSMFFIIISILTSQITELNRNYYIEHTQEKFFQNCDEISTEFSLARSLISSMENTENYRLVSFADASVTNPELFYFNKIRNSFSLQCSLLNTVSSGFVYLKNSQICLTPKILYSTLNHCLNDYFVYEDAFIQAHGTIPDYFSSITAKNTLYPFPVGNISINQGAAAPHLLLLVQPMSGKEIYGFFYSTDTILEAFNIRNLPEGTYLNLTANSGEILYSYNDMQHYDDFFTFAAPIPSIASTATIGIPTSHFDELTIDAQHSAQRLLLLSAFIGLILCICFSYIGVKPLHSMLRTHDLSRTESRNEIDAIDTFIKQNKQRSLALQSMLLSSVLTRTFHGLPLKESEAEALTRDFPLFQESLQLAIVREQTSDPDPDMHNLIFDFLQSKLPEDAICEHINMSELCIISRNEILSFETLQQILYEMNGHLKGQPHFVAGVSAPFTGVTAISAAVRQAQISIPTDGARLAAIYSETPLPETASTAHTTFELKRLQQELNIWNEKETLDIIEVCAAALSSDIQIQPEAIFYNILYLLQEAALNGELSLDAFTDIRYQQNQTPAANIQVLYKLAQNLFVQKTDLQSTEIQQISADLVEYIKTHYDDPALSITAITREFCVSERFAHRAIISQTGINFSKFLLNTRMQEAARLFQETEESISSVALKVGCPSSSTFYRNFKNYYHKTPAEYKEMFSEIRH